MPTTDGREFIACRCDLCVRAEITMASASGAHATANDDGEKLLPVKPARLVPRLPPHFSMVRHAGSAG